MKSRQPATRSITASTTGLDRTSWDNRDDPWAYGDRLASEAAEPDADEDTLDLIRSLNGLPPAVIDWPPYFRPVGTANAVAVTDAITFRGGPLSLLDEWETGEDSNQLLVRALLSRLGPTGLFAARNRLMGSLLTHVERVRPVVAAVLSR